MKPVPVTKRKREEDALRESDIRLNKLGSCVPGMIYQFTRRPDGTYCVPFTTEAIRDIFGCSPQDVREDFSPIAGVILPEDFDRVVDSIERSAQHLAVWECEYRVQIPGRPIRWIYGISTPERLGDGSITWYGFNTDITERKWAEEALQKSEAKLREAQALGRMGSWEFDLDKQTIHWSDQVYKLYERDPSIGPPNIEEEAAYYSHEQAERLHEYARIAAEQGRAFEYDLEVRLPSGRVAHFAATLRPIKDESGRIFKLFGTVQDITERKQAEETLKESEEKYRGLTENINLGIYRNTVGPKGKFIEANPAIIRMFGYRSKKEFLTKNVSDLYQKSENRLRFNSKMLKEGFVRGEELPLKKKDGTPFFGSVSTVAVKDAQGHVLYFDGIIEDITERKRAEDALHESMERFQLANRATFNAIWDWNLQTDALWWNENFQTIFGYRAEEIDPGIESWTNRIHPDDCDRVKTSIHAAIASGQERWFDQFRFLRKDGMYAEVEDRSYIARDASGQPARMIGAMRDITERIRSEKALQASESRYRQLVENANEAIIVVQDGLLKFVNRTAIEMTGYSEAELISRPFLEFIHPDDRKMVMDHHRRRLAGETAQPRYDSRLLIRDGGVRWFEIGAVPLDWEGRPAYLGFLTDVTDRRKAEESIQASLREKEVMLREIHHRVKNNMQVISSLFNLQAGKTRNTECRKILKEGQTRLRAMSLVHEKLYQSHDLSKIDLAVYVRSLADHLFNVYLTDPNQVRLEMNFEEVPLDINSAVPCGLILNELISNSLKHAFPESRKGMIRIGVRPGPDDTIIIRVADNGIGFPKNLDFRQSESLGLQIANLLVAQLEGTIELNRENGTIFTVTFRKLKYAPRI